MTQRPLTISDWRQATAADRAAHAARLDDADPAIFIARGPAGGDGIPLAVKDNIDAAGFATTAACPAYAYKPEASATAVARLEAAGFRVAGKTNLDQFATGLVGVRSPMACRPTRSTPPASRAARPPARPSRSPAGWCRWRSAPTPPGRAGCRR